MIFKSDELTGIVNAGQGSRADLDMVEELGAWLELLEGLSSRVGALISEGDGWRIANERLRERLERHSLEPRTHKLSDPPMSRARRVGSLSGASSLPEPTEDFQTIDIQLAKLNESMKAAGGEALPRKKSGEFASIDAELAKLNQSMLQAAGDRKDRGADG